MRRRNQTQEPLSNHKNSHQINKIDLPQDKGNKSHKNGKKKTTKPNKKTNQKKTKATNYKQKP